MNLDFASEMIHITYRLVKIEKLKRTTSKRDMKILFLSS